MLAIKLQRIGKKHQPSYRLVVSEKRTKLSGGKVTEDLGSYNPFTKAVTVKKERISYWVSVGAKPTVTAHNLLVKEGILKTPKASPKIKKAVAKEAEKKA
jgi:small subunit ribosomal protein S16